MTVDTFLSEFQDVKVPLLGVRLPEFDIEEKYKKELNLKDGASNFDFLRELCARGLKTLKITEGIPLYEEYGKRLKYELGIINELNYTDYFLLVWLVTNFCDENKIPRGMGRGSGAGSLVLYLINVTQVDPIKHGLYFERFISKARAKSQTINGHLYFDGSLLADVDLDIDYYRRGEVTKFIDERFAGKTSKILTFNTLSGKLLIKECGKIIGEKTEEEMTYVSGLIPKQYGIVQGLVETHDGVWDEVKKKWKIEPVEEFKKWCDENPRIYDTAIKLLDLNKNKSVHPSGMLVSFDKLEDCCPTELTSKKDEVSSYEMNTISGFTVKLDILGLRGVSVVDEACKQIGIKIQDIDFDDPTLYQPLQDLKRAHGLFQIEADVSFMAAKKIKPKNLSELSAVMAIARPGALQFIDKFASYTNTGTKDSIHPFFDDILEETGGLCLYQESLLKMANKIGFSLDESEILRRIIGKKKKEEMLLWRDKITDKCKENNLDPEIGELFWQIAIDSASYQFNKSHSVAYACLAAATIYLKFKHPKAFYLSLLKMTQNEPDPISEISKIHREMHNFDLQLLAPSLIKSNMDFSIEGNNIRFGLSAIKGVAGKTIEKFNNFQREFSNKFELFQSAKQAGLNIGIVAAIVQAGCLETLGKNRVLMTYEALLWNKLTDKEKALCLIHGPAFEFKLSRLVCALSETIKDEKGKPLIKASRMATIKKVTAKYVAIYNQNIKSQDYANWWYETNLLGYNFSKTLRGMYLPKDPDLIPVNEVLESFPDDKISFVGRISDKPTKGISKAKKSSYLKLFVTDEFASCKVMIFNRSLAECELLNGGKLPVEDQIVIVSGVKKDGDTIFADSISVQLNTIYNRLAELPDDDDKLI